MPTTTPELIIGIAQVYSYALFLGISGALILIVLAIVVGRGGGGAYTIPRN